MGKDEIIAELVTVLELSRHWVQHETLQRGMMMPNGQNVSFLPDGAAMAALAKIDAALAKAKTGDAK